MGNRVPPTNARRALAAIAVVVVGIATAMVAATSSTAGQLAWALIAVVVVLLSSAYGPVVAPGENVKDVLATLRTKAREVSELELSRSDALLSGGNLDALIPVELDGAGGAHLTAARFAEAVAAGPHGDRWFLEGPAGSGKSTLLHHIAVAVNSRPDGVVAIVLRLATYDWTKRALMEWLAPEIARLVGVKDREVEALIAQDRLLLLLDGLDTVPNEEVLSQQRFPFAEIPFFDQRVPYDRRAALDPRTRLIAKLNDIRGLVVTARSNELTSAERDALAGYGHARLCDIPADAAEARLRHRVTVLPARLGGALVAAIQSPLYLRLASAVCAEQQAQPGDSNSAAEVEAWLWDKHIDSRLAHYDFRDLRWEPPIVRRWLGYCAAAASQEQALSFARWPLLYGARIRFGLRAARSAASALLVGALALIFLEPLVAGVATALTFPIFLVAGEGAATRPLAPQRFTGTRFVSEATRQWPYGLAFTIAGALFGLIVANHWGGLRIQSVTSEALTIFTGTAAGALLGFAVPTLYELNYVDDASLYSRVTPRGAMWSTAASSTMIGLTAGLIVALALDVAFRTSVVFLAVPDCILLALMDSLGLPFAAVLLWAAQRRGPLRIGSFFKVASEVKLVRSVGYYYFFEHGDLQEFLAARVGAHHAPQ
jgi:energy-coupling factor transporter ATP-binding protein EcfA2